MADVHAFCDLLTMRDLLVSSMEPKMELPLACSPYRTLFDRCRCHLAMDPLDSAVVTDVDLIEDDEWMRRLLRMRMIVPTAEMKCLILLHCYCCCRCFLLHSRFHHLATRLLPVP